MADINGKTPTVYRNATFALGHVKMNFHERNPTNDGIFPKATQLIFIGCPPYELP